MKDTTDISLSMIIIGRNEELNLANVFSSALKSAKHYYNEFKVRPNLLYIDSESTDRSLEIALDCGIPYKVIRGKSNAARGRQVGLQAINSKFVFFLDGDTEVCENWLVKGVNFLRLNKKISGVGGLLEFNIYDSTNNLIWNTKNYRNTKKNGENIVDGVGGTFLFKTEDIKEVGGFNTELDVGEEFELLLRMANKGKSLVRILEPMAIHHDQKTEEQSFFHRYLYTKNILIPGKILKTVPKTASVLKLFVYRYWLVLLHFPLLMSFIIFLFMKEWSLSFIIATVIVFLNFVYKGFNIKRSIASVFTMNFYSAGFYIGILKK